MDRHVTLFHALQSRSVGARVLLEELNADYDVHPLKLKSGEQRTPAYTSVNPMGKVPAIKHGDAIVTEQAAVYMYLADLYPEAKLAPPIGDALRGPYLRWMVFYGSCFEPALIDRSMKREPAPRGQNPYADYDTVMKTVADQLEKGPYILGDTFSAADVLWANALAWTTAFKLVPELPVFKAYIERVNGRPASVRSREKDQQLG